MYVGLPSQWHGGSMRVGNDKGYNHMCAANAMPSQTTLACNTSFLLYDILFDKITTR